MANKFAGFTNESMEKKILPSLGYKGAMDRDSINKFLAATPSAAAKMGKYTMIARQMIEGKPAVNANVGTKLASLNPFAGFGTEEYKKKTAATHAAALQAQKDKETRRSGSLADRVALQRANPGQYSVADAVRGDNSGGGAQPAGPVVYGPDGKMYANPIKAQQAGVTNYTTTPPSGGTSGNVNSNVPVIASD